jgi:hypothetical protein
MDSLPMKPPRVCLGCLGCKGMCDALVDLARVPEIVLNTSKRAQ